MLRWAIIYLEAEIEEVILEDAQNISLAEYLVTVAAAICKVFPSEMKLHNVEIQLKVQHKCLTSLILVPPQIPGVLFVAYIVKRRIDTRCSWSRPASGPASRLLRRKLNVGCFC